MSTSLKLEDALRQCRIEARQGYMIAKESNEEIGKAIEYISSLLSEYMEKVKGSKLTFVEDDRRFLLSKLIEISSNLENSRRKIERALEEHQKKVESTPFSIILFGRTMAGKSTLMEILTCGEGKSIGTGAQRTTRDIRVYHWNGLEVTDVPGVAAFEGAKDEEIAFRAADKADLVLFLITDDAPQPVEAECLAKLRRRGKPVLGICNVKSAVDGEVHLQRFLKNHHKIFDQKRIDELLTQFYKLVDMHIPNDRIPFQVVHLRSRFLAGRPGFEKYRDELLKASRFDNVESFIVGEVINRGSFLRIKSFIDETVTLIREFLDWLSDFSYEVYQRRMRIINANRELEQWEHQFRSYAIYKIRNSVENIMNSLRLEVSPFAEKHYEDKSASEKWQNLVKQKGVNENVEELMKEIVKYYTEDLRNIMRELNPSRADIRCASDSPCIKGEEIIDTQGIVGVGSAIASGLLGVGALFFEALFPPALLIGIGGWILSRFFSSREEKARKAREKMRNVLYDWINNYEKTLISSLEDWLKGELLEKHLTMVKEEIEFVRSSFLELYRSLRGLAWRLNDQQKSLAKILVEKALDRLGNSSLRDSIVDVGRVPGAVIMISLKEQVEFPDWVRRELEKLLNERIWFIRAREGKYSILNEIIDLGPTSQINVEEQIVFAHFDERDQITKWKVDLAQQLTGFYIKR